MNLWRHWRRRLRGGRYLCRHLHERGDEVICIDNLSTSWEENLEALLRFPRLRFIRWDISDGFPDCGTLDAAAHLRSPASPPDYQRLALETLRVGASGTEACLKEATRPERARFLLTSMSEVYGEPAVHPQVEDPWGSVNPTGPRLMYDEAKRFAEALTSAYQSRHGTRTGIVRISTRSARECGPMMGGSSRVSSQARSRETR